MKRRFLLRRLWHQLLGLVFLLPSLLRTLGVAFDPAYWLIAVPSNAIIRVIATTLGLA